MLDVSVLPMFLGACLLLAVSPGPDLLLLMSYSSIKGFKAGTAIAGGIFLAGLLQSVLVVVGLAKLLQLVPVLAVMIKLVGALYLLWLGIKLIKNWHNAGISCTNVSKHADKSMRQLFLLGMLNNLLNPKALLFFALFLPQFINAQAPILTQIMLLGVLLSMVALMINVMVSWVVSIATNQFTAKIKPGRYVDGILGILFVGLAARLALSK
ncbi:LysE family translocator [Pseudoalteromonas sp. MMG013]|uniref:LysE family translocator n=1 Tax=Pseudoalteromonas sp. MMG013 TaxID=2822687 RepID=UPI001B360C5B|nr:LysE family translocator [Pseudoalteromonas sp. MMG013]